MYLMATPSVARWCSDILGWTYFLCWSFSFYPQPILNWQRRSTAGFNIDFSTANVLGFICYTVYTATFLFNEPVREQYASRHPKAPIPTVRMNDFAFALHALVLCLITYSQFFPRLWSFQKESTSPKASIFILSSCLIGILWTIIVAIIVVTKGRNSGTDPSTWAWIDEVYAFSYVKLLVTLSKYMPQVLTNYRRKSTVGWSIHTVLLDLAGGILSTAQLVIDAAVQGDWRAISGNLPKLALSFFSMGMDAIFMVQHFILYRHTQEEEDDARQPKLADEQRPLLSANA